MCSHWWLVFKQSCFNKKNVSDNPSSSKTRSINIWNTWTVFWLQQKIVGRERLRWELAKMVNTSFWKSIRIHHCSGPAGSGKTPWTFQHFTVLAMYGNIDVMEHELRSLQTGVSTEPLRADNQLPQLFFPSYLYCPPHGGWTSMRNENKFPPRNQMFPSLSLTGQGGTALWKMSWWLYAKLAKSM